MTPVRRRRERWTDLTTGEIHTYEREEDPTSRLTYNLGGSYHQISDFRTLALIRQEGGIKPVELAVFLLFGVGEKRPPEPCEGDDSPYLDMTVKDVAQVIGMHPDAVGRIARKLRKLDLLVEVRRVGRVIYYRASPHIIFRGTAAEQQEHASRYRLPSVPGMYDQNKIRRVK